MPGRGRSQKSKIELKWGVVDLENPQDYKPWINTRELFHGNGRRYMVPDLVYPRRLIYLMSDLEKEVYFKLRKRTEIIELFEQYPLNLKVTTEICNQEGYRHPVIPKTQELNIMTTDFLAVIDGENGLEYQAFAVKMSKDLKRKRTLEKLKIEKLYWEKFSIPWCIITENNII